MIEQLTDEERECADMECQECSLGRKGLRIIDALTAENAALRAEVERLRAEHRAAEGAEALAQTARMAAESRLAAARFWVEKWRLEENHQDSGDWYMSKVDKALATQPAAPSLMRNPLDPKFKGKNEG